MKNKNPYTLYCLYHNQVFPQYYGEQIDRITFVKMDQGKYIFPAKNHIYLAKESYFHPIGAEWAEYEFYYSLYKGYKEGMIELPEYMGFIQYDMEFRSIFDKKMISVLDYLDELFSQDNPAKGMVIGFSPYSYQRLMPHRLYMYETDFSLHSKKKCMEVIVPECATITRSNLTIDDMKDVDLCLAGAVFIHRDMFLQCMQHIAHIIESKKLDIYNKKTRMQGHFIERYLAVLLHIYCSHKETFPLLHRHGTLSQKNHIIKKLYFTLCKLKKKFLKV